MKILSLFDDISGCQQAFKELGIEFDGKENIYFSSEIDKHAIAITQKNFPNTVQLGNINDIKPYFPTDCNLKMTNYRDKYGFCDSIYFESQIDLLSFGFPCQDLIIAKRERKGLQGVRSGLFYEALRILHKVKPKFFLVENVASMSKENRDIISKELGVEPIMINSALLTSQSRKRYYWVGRLNETTDKYEPVFIWQPHDQGIMLKDILESGVTEKDKSYCLTATYNHACDRDYFEKKSRQLIFENKPERIGHIGKGGTAERIYSVNQKSICLSANGGGGGGKTGLYKIDLPNGEYTVRKLTPIEAERLQGFPQNYTEGIAKTNRYKALGNSFTVPVITHILKHLFK